MDFRGDYSSSQLEAVCASMTLDMPIPQMQDLAHRRWQHSGPTPPSSRGKRQKRAKEKDDEDET
jgi:hypothetical protein